MYDGFDHASGADATNWIFMLMMMFLVVLGIVMLVHYFSHNNRNNDANSALEILKTRYAKGEIDKKEFEEKQKALAG